jgi:two-component system chemotaxis response regulator CheY
MSVLVVDDSATMRRIIRNHLRALGLTSVIEIAGADEALTRVRAGGIKLVIADWAMPGMSGVDLVRAMRAEPASAEIPVLMITGMGQEEDIQAAADAGVDGYIVKPFDLETLQARLQQVLTRAGRKG